jgi:chromosome segregation ATPase
MSFVLLLPWLLLAAAVATAALLFVRTQALARELAASEQATQRVADELQACRKQLDKAVAKQQRSGEELAQSRRKLEKARKRAGRAGEDARPATPSHAQSLEAAIEAARRERNTAREERDAAQARAASLAQDLAKAGAAIDAAAVAQTRLDDAAIEALQQRVETADAAQNQLRKDLTGAHANEKRLREKLDTQQQLYVAIRGELEAKKDRLRTQNEEVERLRALRVAVQEDDHTV